MIIILIFYSILFSWEGEITLTNGYTLRGDVSVEGQNHLRISRKNWSIKIPRNEIKSIKIIAKYEKPDPILEILTEKTQKPNIYDSIIKDAAEENGIDFHLVKAVISVESQFNKYLISKKGAMGLMQLLPSTAKLLGVKNIFDPAENISAGVKFLKILLKEFDGQLTLALAAYNAGPGNVKKYNGIPPFLETQQFILDVMRKYRFYKKSHY